MAATRIGRETRIRGKVRSRGRLEIFGRVEGDIDAREVWVDPGGRVDAHVRAKTVDIAGTVEGDVHAKDAIELRSEARVTGDLVAGRIAIADGAKLKGNVEMGSSGGDRGEDDEL